MTEAKTGGDLNARIKGHHQKLGRDKGCFCPESQRENSPTDTLILASGTVREQVYVVLNLPVLDNLLLQPKETNTKGMNQKRKMAAIMVKQKKQKKMWIYLYRHQAIQIIDPRNILRPYYVG